MSFTPRTKLPSKGNKFYNTTSVGGYSHCIKGKPTQTGLNVLCNCVGWACGRFNEVYSSLSGYTGMKYYQLNCNAEDFITRGKKIGLKVSKVPVVGGIMVWEGKGSLAGHVAFVEKKNSDTQVLTSESGYNHFAFANYTRNKGSNGNWGLNPNSLKYLGCLINPAVKDDEKYTKGIYKCKYNMYIRKSPNGKPVKVKECTTEMKKALTSKSPNADAIVKKGTKFTALAVVNQNGSYWAQNYSGYICINDGKTEYCSKS